MTESERYESLRHCKFVTFLPFYAEFFIQFYITAIVMSSFGVINRKIMDFMLLGNCKNLETIIGCKNNKEE